MKSTKKISQIQHKAPAKIDVEARIKELELIFHNLPLMIWYKDDKNIILNLNENAAKHMNLTVKQAKGANTYDLFPEMAKKYHDDDLEVIQSGIPKLGIVEKFTPKEASQKWVRTDKIPYHDPDTGERSLFVVSYDITEQKEIEEALRKSEERFKLAVEGTRDGIWDWPDMSKDAEYWSPQWKKLLGYEDHEIQASASAFFSFLHPDDCGRIEKALQDHIENKAPFDLEYRLKTKSGEYKWFQAKGLSTLDEETGVRRMTGSITDIDERKKAEAALRESQEVIKAFFESSYDGYWDWEIQKDYEYMSPRFWEMFGYSASEKKHHPSEWQGMVFQEDLPQTLENFEKHVKTKGKHPFSQEVRYRHKNGSTVTVWCRGRVVEWDANGDPVRMIGTHTDVTEKKRFIEQTEAYTKELELRNQELDDFAYIASHDLKEPLRGLNIYSTFLLEDYGDRLEEDGQDKLNSIKRLTERMEELVSKLFHYARLGKENTKHERICLQMVVEKITDTLKATLEEKSIEIRIPKKLPKITGSEIRVREVFNNLIVNATKYNDKEKKWVEVGYKKAKGQPTVFYVRDNGIGIKEKHQESVFRIFKRLNHKNKFGEGTGAGLTIVKKIIEQHDGNIWIESEFGKGTTFYFTFKKKKT